MTEPLDEKTARDIATRESFVVGPPFTTEVTVTRTYVDLIIRCMVNGVADELSFGVDRRRDEIAFASTCKSAWLGLLTQMQARRAIAGRGWK